jgi:hypothetical protein
LQTKKGSIFEQCCNIGSGFILAMLLWNFVVIHMIDANGYAALNQNVQITSLFTVVSLVRGYFWRRLFNWLEIKKIVK